MSKSEIMTKMSRTFNKMSLKTKKYSPEILVGVGIVGVVVSAVMACKETTKASEILDEMHEDLDKVNEAAETLSSEVYSVEDHKKDTTIVYVQTGVKIAKLYAPSIILGTLSITSILAGHNILRKRNLALAAAYATIDKGFKEYRNRVIERFGKELDHELRYNIKAKEFETVEVDEKGKEKVKKETVNIADPNELSDYARFYDDGCKGWSKDPEFNLLFLKQQMNYANDLLKKRGYVFLNEVYEMLGIPKTKAGQIVGWIYDEKNPIGDNFIDFGIYNENREKNRDFVNGYERVILLDFNVDGNILDMI